MAQWLDERAILRDLSLAQGYVPGGVNGALGAGEKPPIIRVAEETEEELFFRQFVGDEDYSTIPPDLSSIQQLLKLVSDESSTSNCEDSFADSETSDVSIKTPTKVTKTKSKFSMVKQRAAIGKYVPPEPYINCLVTHKVPEELKAEKKKARNIAVESIISLNNLNEVHTLKNIPNGHSDDKVAKQCSKKPEQSNSDSHKPVIKTEVEKKEKPKKHMPRCPILDSSFLQFKKKDKVQVQPLAKNTFQPITEKPTQYYVPSKQANDYYEQYYKQSQIKQGVVEDIWMKAEKKMREIDERRGVEADIAESLSVVVQLSCEIAEAKELPATELSSAELSSAELLATELPKDALLAAELPIAEVALKNIDKISDNLDVVRLDVPRHLSDAECIVCKAVIGDKSDRDETIENWRQKPKNRCFYEDYSVNKCTRIAEVEGDSD